MNRSLTEQGASTMDAEMSGIELERRDQERTSNACKTNRINPDCNDVAYENTSKKAAIRTKWSRFVDHSTLHGLQNVFTSASRARRIVWAVFLLLAIAWFSLQSFKLLKKYFSYPVTTKVSLKYEAMPDFPAVTICNFNTFKNSTVKTEGYDQGLNQYFLLAMGTVNNDSIDLSNFNDFNMTQLYYIAGHQINDTLENSCFWNGKPTCDYRNFTPVLTSMGLCHTFNSGKDGQTILKIKEAGSNFGLHLILNVQQQEYFGLQSYLAGLRILIHHQQTIPLVSQLGFAVGPGTSTFAAIRKQRVINLPKPYEGNCYNETLNDISGYTKYTISSCILLCETRFVIKECGCRQVGMPGDHLTLACTSKNNNNEKLNGAKLCGLKETMDCLAKAKSNFQTLKGSHCDCPVPCDTTSFKPVLSYAAFPSNGYVSRLVETVTGRINATPDVVKLIEDAVKRTQERMRQNMLELRVYFEDLNYQVIEETPAYDSESLLGEIGGQVGLCVGASLLTVLEFIDFIITVIGIRLGIR